MSRHIVATVDDIPPGKRLLVNVKGREIGIFNVDGEYLAISNRCPHEGASLCKGRIVGLVEFLRARIVPVQPEGRAASLSLARLGV